jgi:hypothetical protein
MARCNATGASELGSGIWASKRTLAAGA